MPEWAREILHWAALLSPALLILSLLLPAGFPFRKRRWAILAFGLIVIQLLAYQFGTMMVAGFTGLVIVAGAIVFLVFGWRQSLRMHAAWLKQMRAEAPVALQAPFEGPWKASGTGPWAARNHHLAASDQWYATDWVRVEGDARQQSAGAGGWSGGARGRLASRQASQALDPREIWRILPGIMSRCVCMGGKVCL